MSFIDHFETLEDKRSHINKKHELLDVVFLTVVALLSGAEGWKDIKQFGDKKIDWLRKFRPFAAGIPVDDTIARIISALEPGALLKCFLGWVNEIREQAQLAVIAFDGKTLRHSFDGDRKTALHSVSAYAVEQGLVLAQMKSTGKKNEVATVMELIALLSLKNTIVTADAMSCLKKSRLLYVKNRLIIFCRLKPINEIIAFLHKQRRDEPDTVKVGQYSEIDKGHGRIETRHYTQLAITDWLTQSKGWGGLV